MMRYSQATLEPHEVVPIQLSSRSNLKIINLLNSLQKHMALFGYESIETPILEAADLFISRAGDQVISKLFTFERQGQQLALRPEFTATAAHLYGLLSNPGIVRWQFSGPIFLDDPDHAQHSYQHLSAGAELIGLDGPAADAEIIALAVTGLKMLGVTDWCLKIGHTGLTRHLLAQFHLDSRTGRFLLNHIPILKEQGKAYVLDLFDQALLGGTARLDQAAISAETLGLSEFNTQQILQALLDATQRGMTMGGRTRHDIARRLLQKRQRLTERHQVDAALDFLRAYCDVNDTAEPALRSLEALLPTDDDIALALFDELRSTARLLSAYDIDDGKQVNIQPYLARNWEYYTGTLFELCSSEGQSLGGGGRYDELISLVGGDTAVPAVGFAYNLDHVLLASPYQAETAALSLQVLMQPDSVAYASRWANRLRKAGIVAVLAPLDAPRHGQALEVAANGNVFFKGMSYTEADMDKLIAEIGHGLE